MAETLEQARIRMLEEIVGGIPAIAKATEAIEEKVRAYGAFLSERSGGQADPQALGSGALIIDTFRAFSQRLDGIESSLASLQGNKRR